LLILDCCRDELKTFYIGVYKFFPQSVPKDWFYLILQK
jgi:hypothetical protein